MTRTAGRLVLVPNTLDLGDTAVDLTDVLPSGVIRRAAGLVFWAAENARSARAFLKRVQAVQPLARPLQEIAIAELPRLRKGAPQLTPNPDDWGALLAPIRDGDDVGLITDAGLPGVADPGAVLVGLAHEDGIVVETLCGPSSITLALAASGLNGQSFAFHGYLPIEAPARSSRLRELESLSHRAKQTQLFIETPYRNPAMLAALLGGLADNTLLSISCGLSLPGGFTRTATIKGWRTNPVTLPVDTPAVFALLAR